MAAEAPGVTTPASVAPAAASPAPAAAAGADTPGDTAASGAGAKADAPDNGATIDDYRICDVPAALKLAFPTDHDLAPQAGYGEDGTGTITVPAGLFGAKGYIQRIDQDDSGAEISVNGVTVLAMAADDGIAAAAWIFAGKNVPQEFEPAAGDRDGKTAAWLAANGGLAKAVKSIVQGVPLNPGANPVVGRVKDTQGAVRSLSVQFTIRAQIASTRPCPADGAAAQ